MTTLSEVLRALAREGLVDPEAVSRLLAAGVRGDQGAAPWFVRVLVGLGAWVAAIFLLAFLVVADLVPDEAGAVVVGAALFASAAWSRRAVEGRHADFPEQLCLAAWLASQALLLYGLADSLGETAACLGMLAVQGATVAWFRDPVGRFLAMPFAAIALACLLLEWKVPGAVSLATLACALPGGWVYWWRPRLLAGPGREAVNPVAHGLAASTFLLLLASLADMGVPAPGAPATAGLTVGVMALAAASAGGRGPLLQGGLILLGAVTLQAPGVMAALGALALAFHARDRVLAGMAWVFLAVFLTGYYYHLELTLLAKSGVLFGSGAVLLLVRFLVGRPRP